ncbi:hypothetical protein LTR28_007945 [Elasticomyces elasticus]|nr:hypothetical protein LTR28_007945 [Elasticomyces elasticus]
MAPTAVWNPVAQPTKTDDNHPSPPEPAEPKSSPQPRHLRRGPDLTHGERERGQAALMQQDDKIGDREGRGDGWMDREPVSARGCEIDSMVRLSVF